MTIRVMVIDDQAMIRGALAGLLDLETDIEVVAQAANGVEALDELARLSVEETAPRTRPSVDVAIIDVEMPRMDDKLIKVPPAEEVGKMPVEQAVSLAKQSGAELKDLGFNI
ncbi:MAG: response regulator, partial [Pauljensenia sp.]